MERFDVVFDKSISGKASRFVVRGFFTPAEILQAVLRMFLTRDTLLYLGIPLVMLAASYMVPGGWGADWPLPPAQALIIAASIWLCVGAALLLRMGNSRAIAVCSGDTIVGGLRLKVARRRVSLAGVFVESGWRGRGMFSALLLAAFELMAREAPSRGRMEFRVFAPAHPASKRIVQKYLGGRAAIEVDTSPGSQFSSILDMLKEEVRLFERKGICYALRLQDTLLD